MLAGSTKRRRLLQEPPAVISGSDAEKEDDLDENSQSGEGDSSGGEESLDTGDEIAVAQRHVKSKKTQKRKRRATSPSQFGSTLLSLLNTDTPSNQPLSLNPSIAKQRANEVLETKAKKLLDGERKEKEERNHITDVIGGWGGESERALRKVAQRGVVKLFNAIQQTQAAGAAAQDEAKANRGSGKPRLPAPVMASKMKRKDKGAGGNPSSNPTPTMGQDAFLQMIKSGGLVSKA